MKSVYLLVIFTTSFATMCYSMMVTVLISDFTSEEVLSQCFTLGPYLLGLGVGSFFGDKIGQERLMYKLWNVEFVSTIILPVLLLFLYLLVFFTQHLGAGPVPFLAIFIGGGVVSFVAGVLGGAQLPILLKEDGPFRNETVLAFNYLGPLLAGPFIVFCHVYLVPLNSQILFVTIIQMMGLLSLFIYFKKIINHLLSLLVALSMIFILFQLFPLAEFYTVKGNYLGTKMGKVSWSEFKDVLKVIQNYGELERVRTPYQTIDFYTEPPVFEYSSVENGTLYLNRKPQFDIHTSVLYHESMVYAGLNILGRNPESVLILGGGDGLLLAELKKNSGIGHITMVELDAGVLEFSKKHPIISRLNNDSLSQKWSDVEIVVDDAISYIRNLEVDKKFDLVLIDFPFPNGHELSKLYSAEFYQMVKKVMSEEAVVILDMPILFNENEIDRTTLIILKTLEKAFEKDFFAFGPHASFVALASKKELSFDYDKFPTKLSISTRVNLIQTLRREDLDEEEWRKTPVNSMFRPVGL